MKDIYLLTDYKGYFGSKQKSDWYQSGMDLGKLKALFVESGFNPVFKTFSEINFHSENYKGAIFLYTSSEDPNYYYKDYIEDILLGLHYQGAILLPKFEFLRANNNKVFMEILRNILTSKTINNTKTEHFGTIEDLSKKIAEIELPVVIKAAKGAMSKGVYLAKSKKELRKYAKRVSKSKNLFKTLWEIKNYIKHSGKIKLSSRFRKKFILQEYIAGLSGDWKVLVYGDKYYSLFRQNRKNDFRASGSGIFSFIEETPKELLEYAKTIFDQFNVPNISLDIAFDGANFYLIEFQAIYFGTKTIENSPFYFTSENNNWEINKSSSDLETEYVKSICNYINNNS